MWLHSHGLYADSGYTRTSKFWPLQYQSGKDRKDRLCLFISGPGGEFTFEQQQKIVEISWHCPFKELNMYCRCHRPPRHDNSHITSEALGGYHPHGLHNRFVHSPAGGGGRGGEVTGPSAFEIKRYLYKKNLMQGEGRKIGVTHTFLPGTHPMTIQIRCLTK